MRLLDFTIEMNTTLENKDRENAMFGYVDERLHVLADGHDDLTGAAINIRQPASGETPPLHEATVVVYSRPENIAATEKADTPENAVRGALQAVERQVRDKRTRLRERSEKMANNPPSMEMIDVTAAEGRLVNDIEETSDQADQIIESDEILD